MADVNEEMVRLFFEQCGFMVRTNVKYYVRRKGVGGHSDIDLLVRNMRPEAGKKPAGFVLTVEDLRGIESAAVEVKGWHEQNITPGNVRHWEAFCYLARKEAVDAAAQVLKTQRFDKILVVSRLSPQEPHHSEAVRLLRKSGIDHVIEFPTVLGKLVESVAPNQDYPESEPLQTIRLLKRYGLLGDESRT